MFTPDPIHINGLELERQKVAYLDQLYQPYILSLVEPFDLLNYELRISLDGGYGLPKQREEELTEDYGYILGIIVAAVP